MQTSRPLAARLVQPEDNRLLAALQQSDWRHWQPALEPVNLEFGQVLCEPGRTQRHLYFPTGAVVSLVQGIACGASAEIAVVGSEGFVGAGLLLGGDSTTSRSEVQMPGMIFRVSVLAAQDAFDRSLAVWRLLLRSMQALMAQTTVCNLHHTLEQQLCRHLLMCLDVVLGSELLMTQELIAHSLGVRREGVTEAALSLQAAGLIGCTRGRVAILERAGLAQRSCDCYAVVRNECDRLIGVP